MTPAAKRDRARQIREAGGAGAGLPEEHPRRRHPAAFTEGRAARRAARRVGQGRAGRAGRVLLGLDMPTYMPWCNWPRTPACASACGVPAGTRAVMPTSSCWAGGRTTGPSTQGCSASRPVDFNPAPPHGAMTADSQRLPGQRRGHGSAGAKRAEIDSCAAKAQHLGTPLEATKPEPLGHTEFYSERLRQSGGKGRAGRSAYFIRARCLRDASSRR